MTIFFLRIIVEQSYIIYLKLKLSHIYKLSAPSNIYKFCNTKNLPHTDFTKNTNFCLCCMNSRIWVLLATTITVFTSAVFYKLYSTSLLHFPSGPPKKK